MSSTLQGFPQELGTLRPAFQKLPGSRKEGGSRGKGLRAGALSRWETPALMVAFRQRRGQGREKTGAAEGREGSPRACEMTHIYPVGVERLSLYPHMFSTQGCVIKLTEGTLTGEKHTAFVNIYMRRSSQKKSEAQKCSQTQRLTPILTKERGFGLQGRINRGDVTRKDKGN